ncbi:TetR/AcrR family transcriptional regulator [Brenneria uluponensis]|uniref:TetR/AcrR family transcriptional regulator n=1 Tax=Brenneria uluponensis TaxID=3057057 RepID=UPI0028E25A51|nr:TetR/AcrR family transcriptional regulator [Brenneria ulupoensis]
MTTKKQTIIDIATELFNKEGYQAVGIDKIITEAGISKLTLYRNFVSKDQLIIEVLTQRKNDFIKNITEAIENNHTPKDKIFSIFNYYHTWFKDEKFRGCMFTNSLLEFGYKSKEICNINKEMKQALVALIAEILFSQVKKEQAQRIAFTFVILLDGAIISELTYADHSEYSPALLAWATAKTILDAENIVL